MVVRYYLHVVKLVKVPCEKLTIRVLIVQDRTVKIFVQIAEEFKIEGVASRPLICRSLDQNRSARISIFFTKQIRTHPNAGDNVDGLDILAHLTIDRRSAVVYFPGRFPVKIKTPKLFAVTMKNKNIPDNDTVVFVIEFVTPYGLQDVI